MLPGIDGHSAGNRVPDAGAGPRVSRFHDDEGPLLQSHHPEVLRVVQRLQEEAVAGPGVVAQAQVPVLPPAHLQGGETQTRWVRSTVMGVQARGWRIWRQRVPLITFHLRSR